MRFGWIAAAAACVMATPASAAIQFLNPTTTGVDFTFEDLAVGTEFYTDFGYLGRVVDFGGDHGHVVELNNYVAQFPNGPHTITRITLGLPNTLGDRVRENPRLTFDVIGPGIFDPDHANVDFDVWSRREFFTGGVSILLVNGGTTGGPIYIDNLKLTIELASVPEPATWGLMIGGMGLTGGAVRRRRGLALA